MSQNTPNPLSFRPTCDLYDTFLDRARVPTLSWQSYGAHAKFCGYAVTVKCFEDNSRVKELLATSNHQRNVLVVDGGGSQRCALLGDMIAKSAVGQWAGVVVYGCVRDVEVLRTLEIGIVALGSIPRKSTRRGEGQINETIKLGDVWVNPGDEVYVDHDGVVILDPQDSKTAGQGST